MFFFVVKATVRTEPFGQSVMIEPFTSKFLRIKFKITLLWCNSDYS